VQQDNNPVGGKWDDPNQLAHRALAEVSRVRILEELRTAGEPRAASEIAEHLGLHPNTVRSHLDILQKAGLVKGGPEKRTTVGRPRITYEPVAGAMPGDELAGYRLLAHILTSYLAGSSPEPEVAAIEAGQAWGRYLVERPAPYAKVSSEQALRRLVRLFDDLGFAPELVKGGGEEDRMLLHRCPFGDLPTIHPEITCSVHLGLMRGAFAELKAPVKATYLQPFVEPSLCVAHLSSAATEAVPSPEQG